MKKPKVRRRAIGEDSVQSAGYPKRDEREPCHTREGGQRGRGYGDKGGGGRG